MIKRSILIISILITSVQISIAQQQQTWDDTSISKWDSAFSRVQIPSTIDDEVQNTFFYETKNTVPQPLIVSLHTWSGDFTQADPLAKEASQKDWNYIHPNFRGPNNAPKAMGSQYVIADIKDAINYALKTGKVDPKEIHIVGVSGGGYATLMCYMQLAIEIKSFSAWVPISDIDAWYWESISRKARYAKDIVNAVSLNGKYDKAEALRRSPLHLKFDKNLRKHSTLDIYAGIKDGYKGSVPITHSLNMYNKIVAEMKYKTSDKGKINALALKDKDLISGETIADLMSLKVENQDTNTKQLLNAKLHFSKSYQNIGVYIFEGGHEQLPNAISLIK